MIGTLRDVHVTVLGEGPPVVFVHGWRLDSTVEMSDIEPVGADLEGWSRVYLDLPGMGRSAVRPELRTLADYAGWLAGAVRELTAGRSFALAGTSGGAALALAVAAGAGGLCRGLMLRMPLLNGERRMRRVPANGLDEPVAVEARERRAAALWAPAEGRVSTHVQALRADPVRYVVPSPGGTVACPALIVTGRQDTRVGYSDAFGLVHDMPRATFAVLDGAEHEFPYGDRRLFDALVADWLRRTGRHG